MAYISVEYRKFEGAASAIDSYVALMKNKMHSVEDEVTALSLSWQGGDFAQFRSELDKVDNEGSTYKKMVKAMESYARYLRYAQNKYKNVQKQAMNRANSLPRW